MVRLHLYSASPDLIGALVCFVTGSIYYHVSLEVDGYLWEATRRGHVKSLPGKWIPGDTIVDIVLSPDRVVDVVEHLTKHLDDKYGYLSGASIVLSALLGPGLFFTDDASSQCATYVSGGLNHGGIDLPKDDDYMSPADLAQWIGVEKPCQSFKERIDRAFFRYDYSQ